MTVRRKFIMIISLTTGLAILVIFLLAMILFYHNIYDREIWNTELIVKSCRALLGKEVSGLDKTAADYASGEEIVSATRNGDTAYIKARFNDATMLNNNINLVLVLDAEGKPLFARQRYPNSSKTYPTDPARLKEDTPELARALAPGSPLRLAAPNAGTTGTLLLGKGLFLVAARPVAAHAKAPEVHGTLILGRRIGLPMLKEFSRIFNLQINMRLYNDEQLKSDFAYAASSLVSRAVPVNSFNLDLANVAAYGYIEDVFGNPAAILRVIRHKFFQYQFALSTGYCLLASFCLGGLLSFVILRLTGRQILGRLERLDRFVKGIETSRDLSQRIEITGDDEIASLAAAVNRMLAELERDAAEQARLEEQIRQTHKLDAIGQLASGIAHDFNNLLTPILGFANMLKEGTNDPRTVRAAAATVEKAAQRAAELTSKLLGFARRGKFLTIPVNIHEVIQEIIVLLDHTIDKKITIVRQLQARYPYTMGDPTQLNQILLNIALNARDAMPDGGTLTFASDTIFLDAESVQEYNGLAPGRYVEIVVRDTGCGIPEAIRHRVFEPFFTTKDPGKGTGMGLAMVYGIVQNHGGAVSLYSEEGRGTAFTILLPAHDGAVEEPAR